MSDQMLLLSAHFYDMFQIEFSLEAWFILLLPQHYDLQYCGPTLFTTLCIVAVNIRGG